MTQKNYHFLLQVENSEFGSPRILKYISKHVLYNNYFKKYYSSLFFEISYICYLLLKGKKNDNDQNMYKIISDSKFEDRKKNFIFDILCFMTALLKTGATYSLFFTIYKDRNQPRLSP